MRQAHYSLTKKNFVKAVFLLKSESECQKNARVLLLKSCVMGIISIVEEILNIVLVNQTSTFLTSKDKVSLSLARRLSLPMYLFKFQ